MISIGQQAYNGNTVSYSVGQNVQEYKISNEGRQLIERIKAKVVAKSVVGLNLAFVERTLKDWMCLPAKADSSKGMFEGLEVYEKSFRDEEELTVSLISNCLADGQRKDEERLAFGVLGDLDLYERNIDECLKKMFDELDKRKPAKWNNYYGPASELPLAKGWKGVLAELEKMTELDRLYKKVAFFHDFSRNVGVDESAEEKEAYNKLRGEHEGMRHANAKHSLNEKDAQVVKDRSDNQSVWAGTSGSAMDMIKVGKKYGMDDEKVEEFAWVIFAFFHFMPTIKSPTHTFIEVMRGAEKMIKKGGKFSGVDTSSAIRPAVHYHDMDMSI